MSYNIVWMLIVFMRICNESSESDEGTKVIFALM